MRNPLFMKATFVSFLIALVVTPAGMAYPIPMGQVQTGYGESYGPYQVGDGGEFTVSAIVTPDNSVRWAGILSSYDSKTKDIGVRNSFQTFCLELNEPIYEGHTYTANLNNKAVHGGVGSHGDPISKGTAYLYHEFQSGTLEGYNYTGDRWTTAAALQDAIWWLEGEIEDDPENIFSAAVIAMFGSASNAMVDNNGQYRVNVLNLYSLTDTEDPFRQDLLVCDPVPEPATMVLLGSGLIALAGLARKKFKK